MPKKAKITLKPIPVTSGGPQTTKCQRDEISCLYERTRSRRLHERACCAHFRHKCKHRGASRTRILVSRAINCISVIRIEDELLNGRDLSKNGNRKRQVE